MIKATGAKSAAAVTAAEPLALAVVSVDGSVVSVAADATPVTASVATQSMTIDVGM
jgi:hypothetical protein